MNNLIYYSFILGVAVVTSIGVSYAVVMLSDTSERISELKIEINQLIEKVNENKQRNESLMHKMVLMAKQQGWMVDSIWETTDFTLTEYNDHYDWCNDDGCTIFNIPQQYLGSGIKKWEI